MNGKNKVVVLLSGGLDSTVAFYDALEKFDKVAAISFDYGSKHNVNEIAMAKQHTSMNKTAHDIVSLDFVNQLFKSDLLKSGGNIPDGHYQELSMKQTVVPFRNGIMLSVAAGYAESIEADSLVIAAHTGDHAIYPDCREDFTRAMAEAIHRGTYNDLKLVTPFIEMDKAQIVKRGVDLNVDFSKTWSCYRGGVKHCGSCGTCVERREAFILAGVEDPTEYLSNDPLPEKPDK